MAGDAGSTHDFLSLGGDDDVVTPKPSMFDKPDVQPNHAEPVVPPVQARTAVAAAATGAAVAAAGAAAAQPNSNQSAYEKLKADRAKARQARPQGKKKADPLEAKLTNIEKEQDDINKKYAEGSGSGMAILVVACLILLAVLAWLFYMNGDQIIETFKTTPWFRYIWIVVAMYSYANSKY